MLNDAISEVEKLNVVQQLTATIISPSMVNMMTNDKDRCFQCQEHGHIARHFPNNRWFECHEYGHIVMDCPHMIPPLGTPAKHHKSKPHKSHHTRSSSRHHYEDRDKQRHLRSQPHFHRDCSSSHQDPHRGHCRSWHRDTCHHHRSSSQCLNSTYRSYSYQPCHDTPHRHTADHPHTEAHHTTSEIEACCIHVHPTNPHNEPHIGHTCTPVDHEVNHTTGRTPE